MTQIPTAEPATASANSLPARFMGILFAPRATYADVAAQPRWLGIFLTVFLITASAATALMSTEVGRNALLDQQIAQSEAYGRKMTQEQIDRIEQFSSYYAYVAPVIQLVSLGRRLPRHLRHRVRGLQRGARRRRAPSSRCSRWSRTRASCWRCWRCSRTPLNYVRESMTSATNLAVFLPFLDESSFVARLLGSIDLSSSGGC